jgi:hypothetical protein
MNLLTAAPPLPTNAEEADAYEEYFHAHEEANVPQSRVHGKVASETAYILQRHVPGLCFSFDLACYWDPTTNQDWLGPDVAVCEHPGPRSENESYRSWQHGKLRLAGEVASKRSGRRDRTTKLERYASGLKPDEIFYFEPMTGRLLWWEWDGARYKPVAPGPDGRFWCKAVGVWFAGERERLRLYDASGNPLMNYDEVSTRTLEEARRADREQSRREQEEAARREEASRRAAAEAAQQEEASRRAAAEAALASEREEWAHRIAVLEARLAKQASRAHDGA